MRQDGGFIETRTVAPLLLARAPQATDGGRQADLGRQQEEPTGRSDQWLEHSDDLQSWFLV